MKQRQLPAKEKDRTIYSPLSKSRERVMRFLEDLCRNGEVETGKRLPASRIVARHLDVSLSTVQNVFRHLADEGIIRTEQGSGSFWVAPLLKPSTRALRIGLSFGISAGKDQSGPWSTAISGAITGAAAVSSWPISIHPVAVPSYPPSEVLEALRQQEGKIHAMILHPVLEGREILAKEVDLGFPVVHLNPGFTTSLTNFVSTDYYGISQKLGRAWVAARKKRVLFVHNSGDKMNASAALRCAGLVTGLSNQLGNGMDLRIVTGDPYSEESGYNLARESMCGKKGAPPDAIYVVGDALAVGYCRYLQESGLRIPEDVSVVSGGGVSELRTPFRDLTRTRQPSAAIGQALLDMAFHLAEGQLAEIPGKFIPCSFIGGQTTTPEENELLEIQPF